MKKKVEIFFGFRSGLDPESDLDPLFPDPDPDPYQNDKDPQHCYFQNQEWAMTNSLGNRRRTGNTKLERRQRRRREKVQ